MIHHVFIIDARDTLVVQKRFWIIDVDLPEMKQFAAQVKANQALLIQVIGSTKYIGQPLGRGMVILCAEPVDEDTTLLEKIDKVTFEFRRVISYEEEFEAFMMKLDKYVTTKLKVSLLGYGGVGKTTILRLLNGGNIPQTYVPTIGIDIQKVEGARIGTYELLVWDFAGQERFRKLWKMLFSRSRIVFLVTDSTLENVLQSKDIVEFLSGALAIPKLSESTTKFGNSECKNARSDKSPPTPLPVEVFDLTVSLVRPLSFGKPISAFLESILSVSLVFLNDFQKLTFLFHI